MQRVLMWVCLLFLGCFSLTCRASGAACDAPGGMPDSSLLLLGEMHGSREAPALVGRIVCARAAHGPVALGLELPPDEQPAIDRYLASDGGAVARRKLLSGAFWQTDKDGRASTAMAGLLESARHLRREGLPVTVFAFSTVLPGKTYDASIAQVIRDFRGRHPGLPVVALMGNVHGSPTPFQAGGQEILTAAYLLHLHDLHPASVLLAYQSGSIWACMPECGVHKVASAWGSSVEPGMNTGSPMGNYAFSYVLPAITASPPAVGDAPKASGASR